MFSYREVSSHNAVLDDMNMKHQSEVEQLQMERAMLEVSIHLHIRMNLAMLNTQFSDCHVYLANRLLGAVGYVR